MENLESRESTQHLHRFKRLTVSQKIEQSYVEYFCFLLVGNVFNATQHNAFASKISKLPQGISRCSRRYLKLYFGDTVNDLLNISHYRR